MNSKLKCLAVTKGRSVEEIRHVLEETGLTRIGENRLEEARVKFPQLPFNLEKHFLGRLQSRKIPEIVALFDVIQTVENLSQAERISREGKAIDVFIQVNLNGAEARQGASPGDVPELLKAVQSLPHLNLRGLMGLASHDREKASEEFKLLRHLNGTLPELSMGMSEDFDLAIKEGSTMIRLGRRLFESGLPSDLTFE